MNEMEKALRASRLNEIAHHITPEIDDMTAATLRHMFATIQKHDLTADAALQYCFELYSHYKLKQRFEPRRASNGNPQAQ